MKWFKYVLLSGFLAGGTFAFRALNAAEQDRPPAERAPSEGDRADPSNATSEMPVEADWPSATLIRGSQGYVIRKGPPPVQRRDSRVYIYLDGNTPVIETDDAWKVAVNVDAQAAEASTPLLFSRCLSTDFTSIGLKPDEKAAGWKQLFDGTSLNGWNSWKTKQPLKFGAWKAEGGDLVLSGKGGGDIYTAAGYENYELVLEWKTTGNSGILLRVDPSHKGAIWNKAPEMQVDKGNKTAKNSTSAGGLYGLYDFTEEKVFHPDDWNHVKVRCEDGHFTIWFNHKLAHDFTIGSDDWKARVAKSKFKKFEGFGELKKGHIGLQDHGRSVRYRNIKIREL